MAYLKGLDSLNKEMRLQIHIPMESGEEIVEVMAEHIWGAQKKRAFYHGFRFDGFNGFDEEVLDTYIGEMRRKSAQSRKVVQKAL